jgi:transaldolase/glucose-6-phosphate isomerase
MTKLEQLADLGQAIWLDFIRRSLIAAGELQSLVDEGLRGMTSNPTIFEKAISGSDDYDEDMRRLVADGASIMEIYEVLAFDDICAAADVLRPVYDRTAGTDGYVSLEVNPKLAHDTEGTIAEARRLFATLDRPNVMIKVPATPEGIPAIETLIGEGINVNVTLIFSLDHYRAAAEAYLAGLERLAARGGDLFRVASVASFFVSRIDTAVDRAVDSLEPSAFAQGGTSTVDPPSLKGKIAIASVKAAYALFHEIFAGPRWEALAVQGARYQRPLWASTGTKNPAYSDTLYVDSLIGPNTVNTVPPATLEAFREHGTVARTLETGLEEAQQQLAHLGELGIDLEAITRKLQEDGVASFAESFESLIDGIAEKCEQLRSNRRGGTAALGPHQAAVDAALAEMAEDEILARIWDHDFTVWKPEPIEITNRLGWLHIAETMLDSVDCLESLVDGVQEEGYTDVLLLGMGGSSLAAEVFSKVLGRNEGSLRLAVLDSTDPGAVLGHAERLDPAHSLFVVAIKSGSTTETLSFFRFFYNWTVEALGADEAGEHFVALTDPGSQLADLAERFGFRETFLNDPNIGGRYSALSFFGLLPAAMVGVDISRLLDRALDVADACESWVAASDSPAAWLGAILGELAKAGRDKVTFVTSPRLGNFGDWVEQLIAESTGKEGKGIVPVVGEPLGTPAVYGDDRLFVYLRLEGDETHDAAVNALESAGQPVVRLRLNGLYDLGGQIFLWELATAVAGYRLGINPFDQPNVEAAKVLARQMVAAYSKTGALPEDGPAPLTAEALDEFLAQARPGDYIALQAYVERTAETDAALLALRTRLRDRLKLATTAGYGPRFLHSTGQLHKGDAGHGLFIQFTSDAARDVPIPDEASQAKPARRPDGGPEGGRASGMTFGVLKMAQALGDKQALLNTGRRVIRFHLGTDVSSGLKLLAE